MAWSRHDPGAGDVGAISEEASARRARAELLRKKTLAPFQAAIADAGSASWVAQAATAFVDTGESLLPDLLVIIRGLDNDAGALDAYSTLVDGIKTDATTLRYRQDALQDVVSRGISALSAPDYASELSAEESQRLTHRLGENQHELARLDAQWHGLEQRRRDADAACVAALDSSASRGTLARLTGAGISGLSETQLLDRLQGLSAVDVAILFAQHPELAERLASSTDPDAIARWWNSYADSEHPLAPTAAQLALVTAIPAVLGNLNGVAYWARDRANRMELAREIGASKERLRELRDLASPGTRGTQVYLSLIAEEQARLDGLNNIRRALRPNSGAPTRHLVSLTGDRPPLAAVSIGDLDAATRVTYCVPGMNTTTAGMAGWTSAAQNLYTAQGLVAGDSDRAVVAWIGYETPPTPDASNGFDLSVMHGDHARAGAILFDRDLAGLNAVRAGSAFSLNVVAHSYGTTTASLALAAQDLHVDSFVSLGSAGIETSIHSATDIHASSVYAGQAQDVIPGLEGGQGDQWAWTGRAGSGRVNPMDSDFGAITFNTDGVDGDPEGEGVTDHSATMGDGGFGYLDRRTESLHNAALATTGQGASASAWKDPGLTPLQQSLITSMESPGLSP